MKPVIVGCICFASKHWVIKTLRGSQASNKTQQVPLNTPSTVLFSDLLDRITTLKTLSFASQTKNRRKMVRFMAYSGQEFIWTGRVCLTDRYSNNFFCCLEVAESEMKDTTITDLHRKGITHSICANNNVPALQK